jgi:diguanylate cyclase (GGDEF)-like protein
VPLGEDSVSNSFAALIQQSRPQVLVLVDRCGQVLDSTNPEHRVSLIAGHRRSIFDYVHPDDQQRTIESFRTVADGFTPDASMRLRGIRQDGEHRLYEVLFSAPRDFLPIDGVLITFGDVTTSSTNDALHSISRRIALSPLDETDNAIEDAFGDAMLVTGLSSTTMFVPGKTGSVFHVVKSKHFLQVSQKGPVTVGPLTDDMPAVKKAITLRRAIVIRQGDDPVAWDAVNVKHLPQLHHVVIVPLFAAEQLEGFAFFGCTSGDQITAQPALDFLETVGELIAGAMARQRTSHELHDRAFRDPLTQLPNRRLLIERLDEAMNRTRRTKTWVALIVIDCDGFKAINDAYGHQVGDMVLISVADRLQSVCRSGELVARFGGDEFVVMLESELPEATVGALGQRIVEILDTTYEVDGNTSVMTASVGVAVHRGDADPLDATAMFKRADLAMYRAKAAGKNRAVLFTEEMEAATRDRFELTSDLRTAMKTTGELSLWYQPVVDLPTSALVGYEALIRWNHPQRGILLPASFIELAEDSGQIVELGWVLMEMALDQFRGWRRTGRVAPLCSLAINLSIRQLVAPDFIPTIAKLIEASHVPPHLLELELTETVFADRETIVPRLRQLQELGANLSIDDFGTGYSSLAYLRDLPVDIVKMDKSFIARLGSDPRDEALVSALINVSHELGLVTIAEGVETHDQAERLRGIGCDKAQGYLFGRPAPDVVQWTIAPISAAPNLLPGR